MTDHSLSAEKIRNMGIDTYIPCLDTEHKRLRTKLGSFQVDSFPVPHNGTENRNFLIRVDGQTILFLIDLEYCPYDFSKLPINILICECNYINSLVDDDIPNLRHKVLGHCELDTTIGIIKNCKKHLRKVFLTHASKGATMDKAKALEQIKASIPEYIEVEFVKDNTAYDISDCPF